MHPVVDIGRRHNDCTRTARYSAHIDGQSEVLRKPSKWLRTSDRQVGPT